MYMETYLYIYHMDRIFYALRSTPPALHAPADLDTSSDGAIMQRRRSRWRIGGPRWRFGGSRWAPGGPRWAPGSPSGGV